MLGNLLTGTLGVLGQIGGEIAHQTGKAYDAVADEAVELKDAVVNSGDTLSKGYDEELFTADQKENVKEVVAETVEAIKDKVEEAKEKIPKKFTTTPLNDDVES